ncbi:MAG: hypothetical protein GX754_05445 [Clostridiaceae bacterium]|nr:hypothetical protein [Clostridiaceae bacterium]
MKTRKGRAYAAVIGCFEQIILAVPNNIATLRYMYYNEFVKNQLPAVATKAVK